MTIRKTLAGIATATALAGAGTVVADQNVNPYTDQGETFFIETQSSLDGAGAIEVDLAKAEPEITLSKWNGEASLTVVPEGEYGPGTRAFLTERMEWKNKNQEVHAYPLKAKAGMEDGGFEIEISLKGKPETNRFHFVVEGAEELDFFYQPALTPDELKQGAVRPENVIGSYAVYHKEKEGRLEEGTNYGTGKAFHIFRPKAIDARGRETWAELTYINGVLIVEVPQAFLDTSYYPVRVDPTIGYTSQGASDWVICSGAADNAVAWKASGLAGGTVTKISQYLRYSGSPDVFRSQIWNDAGGGTVPTDTSPPYSSSFTTMASSGYTLQEISLSYVFSGSVQWVGVSGGEETGSGQSYIAYDTGGSAGTVAYRDDVYVWQPGTSERFSVYATYTAAPAGSSSITSDAVFFE